ncbi:hypothetical protein [Rhodococcus sp. MALMAid1271]|uniref:hypothetical protein n=1 Tax=Rhodococcus sp. MALMAid1271 TaxID=3411744 RepID=UPI003BA0D559
MTTDRYQRGMDRMMDLVAGGQANTFDHAKLVESYKDLDPELADYIISFAFGDIYSRSRQVLITNLLPDIISVIGNECRYR